LKMGLCFKNINKTYSRSLEYVLFFGCTTSLYPPHRGELSWDSRKEFPCLHRGVFLEKPLKVSF
jgi:hypothetical protein